MVCQLFGIVLCVFEEAFVTFLCAFCACVCFLAGVQAVEDEEVVRTPPPSPTEKIEAGILNYRAMPAIDLSPLNCIDVSDLVCCIDQVILLCCA